MTESKFKYTNVLLIDDNEIDNFINENILLVNKFSKNIFVSLNGEIALNFVKNFISSGESLQDPCLDLVFVDLNMPIMDGFEFIMNFKKINNEKLIKCKIIILTSSIHNSDRIMAKEMDNRIVFLNKPLTNEVLEGL